MIFATICGMNNMHGKTSSSSRPGVTVAYVSFIAAALLVYHWLAEGEFSAILTVSAVFQCLAFSLLGLQALSTKSVGGISAKSLQLEALALACRLSSTVWLQGYLPADRTGDYLYQVFDITSLCMVLWLLHRVMKVQRWTYDADEDTLPTAPFALACLVLAAVFKGDLDDRPIFDILWMCGLFLSCISVLPQLHMMMRGRTRVPALIGHFVAVMAVARILSGTYMWHAHGEMICDTKPCIFAATGNTILAAHAVHLMLLGDFGFFYGKHLATAGLTEPLQLPQTWTV